MKTVNLLIEKDDKEKKEMKLNSWKDCVVKDAAWVVNDQIKNGGTIYRIKTDYVDIKGMMTISNVNGPRISIDFDGMCGIPNTTKIYIVPEMRVFKTDSEDDPGLLLQDHEDIFNPELCVDKFYRVINSNTGIQYMMYIRSITDDAIDVIIINALKDLDNKSSIKTTNKEFDTTELIEYKFKEI